VKPKCRCANILLADGTRPVYRVHEATVLCRDAATAMPAATTTGNLSRCRPGSAISHSDRDAIEWTETKSRRPDYDHRAFRRSSRFLVLFSDIDTKTFSQSLVVTPTNYFADKTNVRDIDWLGGLPLDTVFTVHLCLILCCNLHLPSAALEARCPHFLLQIRHRLFMFMFCTVQKSFITPIRICH